MISKVPVQPLSSFNKSVEDLKEMRNNVGQLEEHFKVLENNVKRLHFIAVANAAGMIVMVAWRGFKLLRRN